MRYYLNIIMQNIVNIQYNILESINDAFLLSSKFAHFLTLKSGLQLLVSGIADLLALAASTTMRKNALKKRTDVNTKST